MTGWGRTRGKAGWAKATRGSLDGCRNGRGFERCAASGSRPTGPLLSVGPRSHAVAEHARRLGLDLGGVTLDLGSPTRKVSAFMDVLPMPESRGLLVAIR